jgi:phage terminase large subunit-like protein
VPSIAEQYIADVISGKEVAGPWIIKACLRHRRDLEHAAERGFYFDPAAGQHPIDFIQEFCIPPESEECMVLTPWQHLFLYITYGWKRIADNTRRFRRAYLEIAKKNGKTSLAAALVPYHLIADNERSARVFCAATTAKQADTCFKQAAALVARSPELKGVIHQAGNDPHILALFTDDLGRASKMSREAGTEDGAMVSCSILDELHRWKSGSGLYSILRYGARTRKQPLMIETTTAGASADGTSLCWSEREYGTKILDEHVIDDEFVPFIFCMDPKDDWKDPKNWVKSNPSMGYLFDEEKILKEFNEAQGKPTSLGEFKRFALNIWSSESADPAIEIEKWDACCREDIATHPDAKRLRKEALEQLKGRLCFGGIDLAPKLDTSSLVLLFPPLISTEKWNVLEYFWCPADNIADRVKRDRVPYDVWRDDGFIVPTPGNLTDVRYIAEQIAEINKQFDLKEVAYDDAWSSELIRMLGESKFPMEKFVPFPQSHLRMNAPCQELMRKVLRGEFAHARNPVMRWQMASLRWNTQSGTNFVKPARDRKRDKIDGPASLIMALARATAPENQVKPKKPFWVVTSA